MVSQLIATFLFIAIHLGVSGTALRGRIIASIGEKPYLALFSLASLGLLIWLSNAYAGADYVELWPHSLALVCESACKTDPLWWVMSGKN